MEWKTITKSEAAQRVAEWRLDQNALRETVAVLEDPASVELNDFYRDLRGDLCDRFERVSADVMSRPSKKSRDYQLDLAFGIQLYETLGEHGFSARTASVDPVWMYLSVVVVPDLVYQRYGGVSEDRYYAKKRRIWLKSLWWYIYLSMQQTDGKDDLAKTREVLRNNSTDSILQIVDRAGPGGYRVEMTRELMRRYAEKAADDSSGRLLRRLMVLHVARARIMEPELVEGGIPGYVDALLAYFDEQ